MDVLETEALGDLLARLREQLGLTMIVIEHDIPLVMRLAGRVIAMESGRVLADGPPEVVRHDPLVVESYLGGDLSAIERSTHARAPRKPAKKVAKKVAKKAAKQVAKKVAKRPSGR